MRIFYTVLIVCLSLSALSAQAPTLLADINPGAEGSSPTRFFAYGDQALFRAESPNEGVELWISDGTPPGTRLLRNINTNASLSRGNSNPDNFVIYDGRVYFKARADGLGDELWVTDGTPEGTQLLKDIQEGEGNANPFDMVVFNGLIFFTANNGNDNNSSELWISDGTADGTQLFLDLNPGGPGNPINKTVIGDKLYFAANDGTNGVEPWVSDGTPSGTMMLADLRPGGNSSPSNFFEYNGEVYFRANDGSSGVELWKTDGTTAGTVLVRDINAGEASSRPDNFFLSKGWLFFSADDGISGNELWATNGTPQGTQLAIDFNTGSADGNPESVRRLLDGDLMLLVAESAPVGRELFVMFNESDFGESLNLDTIIVEIAFGTQSSDPEDLIFTGSELYFSAETAETGRELYRVSVIEDEGNEQGPVLVADINPGMGSAEIDDITLVGDFLFFAADNGTLGEEPWSMAARVPEASLDIAGVAITTGDTLDFGNVLADGTTYMQTITLTNTGTGALYLYDYYTEDEANGPFTVDFETDNIDDFLLPGEIGTIEVGFTPTQAGQYTDTLVLLFSVGEGEFVRIILTGSSIEAIPVLEASVDGQVLSSDDTIDFGMVEIGRDSTIEVVIYNPGNADLIIEYVALNGGPAFSVANLITNLPAGGRDTLTFTFAPQDVGDFTGQLIFTTNDSDNQNFVIRLMGSAQPSSTRDLTITVLNYYPNPVRNTVTVQWHHPLDRGYARLYDVSGRLLRTYSLPEGAQQHEFDLSALPSAHYSLELRDRTGRGAIRLVKE